MRSDNCHHRCTISNQFIDTELARLIPAFANAHAEALGRVINSDAFLYDVRAEMP